MNKIELKELINNEPNYGIIYNKTETSLEVNSEKEKINYLEKKVEWLKDILLKLAKDYISNK